MPFTRPRKRSSLWRLVSLLGWRKIPTAKRSRELRLELLEDRSVPATFVVNSVLDTVDANPGDMVAADASGNTTLRAAIMEANEFPGDDTITFDPAINGQAIVLSIAGTGEDAALTGDLDISSNIVITGNGAANTSIDGDGIDRVFEVHAHATVDLSLMTVANGLEERGGGIANDGTMIIANSVFSHNTATSFGGAIYNLHAMTIAGTTVSQNSAHADGGGIYNYGTLSITAASVLSSNTATWRGGAIRNQYELTISESTISNNNTTSDSGGAIYNSQSLSMTDTVLSNNCAASSGGGIHSSGDVTITNGTLFSNSAETSGGAICTSFALTITDTVLSENVAGENGGAICNTHGSTTITRSTLSDNEASSGGGLYYNAMSYVTLTVNDTTLVRNSAIVDGGAILNKSTAGICNSTFSENTAGSFGGGIRALDSSILTIKNSTFALNNASSAGGGIYTDTGTTVNSKNTVIASNGATGAPDVVGTYTSQGHNVVGDPTGSSGFTNGVNGDQVGSSASPIDPKLGPLQNNGGPTETHALLTGSPAIDAGDNTDAPDTDQRGMTRIVNGTIDIGAYELDGGTDTTPPTVVLSVSNITTGGGSTHTFTVTYSDDTAVDVSDLDGSDVRVTGPASFSQLAALVSVDVNSDGTPRTATYQITAPGGTWDADDDGTYTVSMVANQVSDTSENHVAAGTLGTFTVQLDQSGVFVVNSVLDSPDLNPGDGVVDTGTAGVVTLRAAMMEANELTGHNIIHFDIPGSGVRTIQPTSPLPPIEEPLTIDGTTQPGYAVGAPLIELDGQNTPADTDGLDAVAGYSTIRGLIINRFTDDGIRLRSAGHNTVEANFIGVDATGSAALGNQGDGIVLSGTSSDNTIGGDTAGTRNIISGNGSDGIQMSGAGISKNSVTGNYIGINAAGTAAIANGGNGIYIAAGAAGNWIGGAATGEGNVISGNQSDGIEINGTDTSANYVRGNLIGTDSNGVNAVSNVNNGIYIGDGATGNYIGGAASGQGNVISGNQSDGIEINGTGTSGNYVLANLIGTNNSATSALPNSFNGVLLYAGAHGNYIGGSAEGEGNIISGNQSDGIEINGTGTSGNYVLENLIGTNSNGANAIANGNNGIYIGNGATGNYIGIDASAQGNVISGNQSDGIEINGSGTSGNYVRGNLIGTNSSATAALPNLNNGVLLYAGAHDNYIGGSAIGEGNIISGNQSDGIELDGSGTSANHVLGNVIGINSFASVILANGNNGVKIHSGAHDNFVGGTGGGGNIIVANLSDGVDISGAGSNANHILANMIGLFPDGRAVAGAEQLHAVRISDGAQYNLIGTDGDGVTDAAERNVLAGNESDGVYMTDEGTSFNVVAGNYIGVSVDGATPLPNDFGVRIDHGASDNRVGTDGDGTSDDLERNVISGNRNDGVGIFDGAHDNIVAGNYIGVDVTGTVDVGNAWTGVVIQSSSDNLIGGDSDAERNVISGNIENGIEVRDEGTGNSLLGNVIYSNGQLGIDLDGDGVTSNDSGDGDTGTNDLQNFPVLTVHSQDELTVSLDSVANTTFHIELFSASDPDSSGYGEGQTFLMSLQLTTASNGHAEETVTLPAPVSASHWITATATNLTTGSTSEFALSAQVTGSSPDKIGVRREHLWFLDADGNGRWNNPGDTFFGFGIPGDEPVVGDWNGDGVDEVGVRRGSVWYLDCDGNGRWNNSGDTFFTFGIPGDEPVVGDWNGDGVDEVGIRRGSVWYLDYDGNGRWNNSGDTFFAFGIPGDEPVVGDWNGDGVDEVGVHRGSAWYLDYDGNGRWNHPGDSFLAFGIPGDEPVVGDWNGDGVDDVGVRRGNVWYLDYDGNGHWNHPGDSFFVFGVAGDEPVVGRWSAAAAAPAAAAGGGAVTASILAESLVLPEATGSEAELVGNGSTGNGASIAAAAIDSLFVAEVDVLPAGNGDVNADIGTSSPPVRARRHGSPDAQQIPSLDALDQVVAEFLKNGTGLL